MQPRYRGALRCTVERGRPPSESAGYCTSRAASVRWPGQRQGDDLQRPDLCFQQGEDPPLHACAIRSRDSPCEPVASSKRRLRARLS
eukprot:6224315-Prymnesium_polylepis.1